MSSDSFAAAVQSISESRRSGSHPEPEDLLAYHDGRLDGSERDDVQDHIAECPICTDFVLELERVASDSEPREDPGVELALQEVRKKIGIGPLPTHPRRPIPPPRRLPIVPLALAATFALVALGLGIFSAALRSDLADQKLRISLLESELAERSSGPSHSFEITSLDPTSTVVRGDGPRVLSSNRVPIVLSHLAGRMDATYRAELVDSEGVVVWTWRGMRPTKAGNFTVDLPASLRETGGYRIDLFRLEEYQPVLEASFDLTLTN